MDYIDEEKEITTAKRIGTGYMDTLNRITQCDNPECMARLSKEHSEMEVPPENCWMFNKVTKTRVARSNCYCRQEMRNIGSYDIGVAMLMSWICPKCGREVDTIYEK